MSGIGLGLGLGLGKSGSGALWTPTQLSGKSLWLRSDLGVSLDGSNNVQNWTDQANGFVFTQATAGNRPGFASSGGPQNTPRVTLNGSQWLALAQSIALGPSCSFLVVGRFSSTTAVNTGLFCASDAGSDFSSANGVIIWNSGTNGTGPTGANSGFAGVQNGNNVLAMDTFHAYRMNVSSAPVGTTFADGASIATWTPGAASATPTVWAIGSRVISGAAGSNRAVGDVCEIIVKATAFTAADLANLSSYTQSRYRLAA